MRAENQLYWSNWFGHYPYLPVFRDVVPGLLVYISALLDISRLLRCSCALGVPWPLGTFRAVPDPVGLVA
jgi:hypothetical protein